MMLKINTTFQLSLQGILIKVCLPDQPLDHLSIILPFWRSQIN